MPYLNPFARRRLSVGGSGGGFAPAPPSFIPMPSPPTGNIPSPPPSYPMPSPPAGSGVGSLPPFPSNLVPPVGSPPVGAGPLPPVGGYSDGVGSFPGQDLASVMAYWTQQRMNDAGIRDMGRPGPGQAPPQFAPVPWGGLSGL